MPNFFYSVSAKGFYLNGDNMPGDAKPISEQDHASLMRGYINWTTDPPSIGAAPEPSAEAVINSISAKVQAFMDSKASERGYDNIRSAALRAALPGSPFHAEGVAYGEWMDKCWASCYVMLNKAQKGEIPTPTAQDVINQLPTLVLSNTVF